MLGGWCIIIACVVTLTPTIASTLTPTLASTLTPIIASTLTPTIASTLTPTIASTLEHVAAMSSHSLHSGSQGASEESAEPDLSGAPVRVTLRVAPTREAARASRLMYVAGWVHACVVCMYVFWWHLPEKR